jgi:hypothetical protein
MKKTRSRKSRDTVPLKGQSHEDVEKHLKYVVPKARLLFKHWGANLISSESSICGPLGLILCTVLNTLSADSRDEPTLTLRAV